jgi:hypothetical protein
VLLLVLLLKYLNLIHFPYYVYDAFYGDVYVCDDDGDGDDDAYDDGVFYVFYAFYAFFGYAESLFGRLFQ